MSRILGAKFRDFGQIYYFDSGPYVVEVGDHVIVETDQGRGLAKVAVVRPDAPEGVSEESVKTIFRLANAKDFEIIEENKDLGRQAFVYSRKCVETRKLEMKLVDVEIFYDRSKMIFYFTAPGRVDFRELVKDLVREYRTRIELRQIGVRHETQMIGAVGNCGQVCCCRRFMRTFDPVTIKMAKEQNLFLNPTKISGICGRLLCCLNFEQKNYEDFQRKCPKIGKRHDTSLGVVKVIRSNFFRNSLTLITENNEEREVCVDDWADLQAGILPASLEVVQEKNLSRSPVRDHSTPHKGESHSGGKTEPALPEKKGVPGDSAVQDKAMPLREHPASKDDVVSDNAASKEHAEEQASSKTRGKSRGGHSRRGSSRRRGRGSKSSDNPVSGNSTSGAAPGSEKNKPGPSKPGQSRPSKARPGQKVSGANGGSQGGIGRKKSRSAPPRAVKTDQGK